MDEEDLIDTLNDLIETCTDGEYGFHSCAEDVDSPELATLFERRAQDCREAARELQEHVVMLGGEPDTSGSVSGALHRGWVAVRTTLSTYDDLAVLEECERGENVAVTNYRKALEKLQLKPLRSLVERQYQGAKRNYEQICALRDGMQANA